MLANEQVIDGKGWRSGAPVEKREIPMYYLRITDYADELLDNLDRMTGWPERVRVMQANWIGKSRGVRFAFPHDIHGSDGKPIGDGRMHVFTTRADTIMGVTFCAVAAEHPLAMHAAKSNPALAAFVDECRRGGVSEVDVAAMEKKGMPTGLFVAHPLTGEKVEVWIGNYVLMAYGDGAVMGVPAHDERDFAFAKKYGLRIKQVIAIDGETFSTDAWQPWYEDKTRGHCVDSGKYDGLAYEAAVEAIAADLAAKGLGEKKITYRLRDWGVSRQRYWGTPIPIVHCPACGDVPVPEEDLPVVLPEDCVPEGAGNPLAKRADFVDTMCPKCGGPAKRETDTLDTFVDSSWYYMRYASHDAPTMVDARNDYWNPMDQYIGGIEHAILHLLYARFWTKAMRDMGLVKFDEPFTRLMTQGMLLNHIFFRRTAKGGIDYYAPAGVDVHARRGGPCHRRPPQGRRAARRVWRHRHDVEVEAQRRRSDGHHRAIRRRHGAPVRDVRRLAARTARCGRMPASKGAHRFLRRLWAFAQTHVDAVKAAAGRIDAIDAAPPVKVARREVHLTLKQATYDYERVQYNTVISAGMKMLNALEAMPADVPGANAFLREGLSILLRVLYPVAPHIGCALWDDLGLGDEFGSLLDAPWPEVDPAALAQDEIELVLQVNGKLRGKLTVPSTADKAAIEGAARESSEVVKHAAGAAVKKIIIVPGRLVNVVV